MQLDMGGNDSCFVYFDGASLHGFFAPSGHHGRPGNPNSRQERDAGLPLVLGTEFGIRDKRCVYRHP